MKFTLAIPALAVTAILFTGCSVNTSESPSDFVNPFIGATTSIDAAGVYHGLGKTFPGATTPFGMTQVSPDTITGGDNGPGYSDEHRTMEGFAFTHMSGIGWYGDFGNLLTMPTTGELRTIAGLEDGTITGWRSAYDKQSECAGAGYYAVDLTDYGIHAEATASPRGGMLRFTYPAQEVSRIQIDLARRVGGCAKTEYVKVIDDRTIEGWMYCPPECGGWGNGAGNADYTLYFHAEFSKPFSSYGFWSADIPEDWVRRREEVVSLPYLERVSQARIIRPESAGAEIEGPHIGFFAEFPTEEGEQVSMSAAVSYCDLEGARKNFEAELAGKDFDELHAEAKALWDRELSRVKVEGGSEEDKTIFYTALYHTMIDPRIHEDVDGRYVGGDLKVHESDPSFVKRTIFSGWDVFRSQMPLYTIVNPEMNSDLINSLVTMAEQSGRGYLERWEIVNSYSGCMLGNPALSVIADAYVKGIKTFDVQKAYDYSIKSSEHTGNGENGYTSGGLSVSHTLEYAYFDWCLSRLAEALGDREGAELYGAKGKAYANVFDPEFGWFRPRNDDGSWQPAPEDGRIHEGYGTIESNPFQQGWFVPQDVDGLVELIGGREKALKELELFFANTPLNFGWNQYYNHANEPVHLVPFLFNALGAPWETQKWTRIICRNAYHNSVEGICGNEDCGQMSAWYVLAASGIHPLCPGDTRMEITSPVFDRIEFSLDDRYYSGGKFTITAHDNSPENIYIQKAALNGAELTSSHIDFSDISSGGELELWMGPEPSSWGVE
ncbi:MAG: glycoside hydrolase family 92 protein [Bacteroidales bacterium]|nr:glycoside hydrolase family 92 protein [Bacteroidales bacterium]